MTLNEYEQHVAETGHHVLTQRSGKADRGIILSVCQNCPFTRTQEYQGTTERLEVSTDGTTSNPVDRRGRA